MKTEKIFKTHNIISIIFTIVMFICLYPVELQAKDVDFQFFRNKITSLAYFDKKKELREYLLQVDNENPAFLDVFVMKIFEEIKPGNEYNDVLYFIYRTLEKSYPEKKFDSYASIWFHKVALVKNPNAGKEVLKKVLKPEEDTTIEELLNYSDLALSQNDFKTAFRGYSIIIEKDINNGMAYRGIVNVFYEATGRSTEAIKLLKNVLEKHPNTAAVFYGLGYAYYKNEEYELSVNHFRESIRIEPTFSLSWNNLAAIYLLNNNLEMALNYVTKALELDPNLTFAINNFAMISEKSGRFDYFLEYMEKLKTRQNSTTVSTVQSVIVNNKRNQARSFFERGNIDESITILEESLTLARTYGNKNEEFKSLELMGELYYRQDKKEKAIEFYEKISDLTIESDLELNIEIKIGNIYRELKQYQNAISKLNSALISAKISNKSDIVEEIDSSIEEIFKIWFTENLFKKDKEKIDQIVGKFSQLLQEHIKRNIHYFYIKKFIYKSVAYDIEKIIFAYNNLQEPINTDDLFNLETGEILSSELFYNIAKLLDSEDDDIYFTKLIRLSPEQAEIVGTSLLGDWVKNKKSGNIEAALQSIKFALKIYRHLEDNAAVGTILLGVGDLYQEIGDHKNALDYFKEANKSTQLIRNDQIEFRALDGIGRTYYNFGKYKDALFYSQKALKKAKEIGKKENIQHALNKVAAVYLGLSDYQTSLDYLNKSLKVSEEMNDKYTKATTLGNIAVLYGNLGNPKKAEEGLEEALSIYKELGDKGQIAYMLTNLSTIYRNSGNFEKSINCLFEALKIFNELGDIKGEGLALNHLGLIYRSSAQYERALVYFKKSFEKMKLNNDIAGIGLVYSNIGLLYEDLNNHQESLNYLQKSLKISKQTGNRSEEGKTLRDIAGTYKSLNDFSKALTYYKEALKISKDIGDKECEESSQRGMGFVYQELGKYKEALNYFKNSLKINRSIENRVGELISLAQIGYIYEQKENWVESVDFYKQAIELLENIRGHLGLKELKTNFWEQYVDIYSRIVNCLLKQKLTNEAFFYAERSKARTFFEIINESALVSNNELMNLYEKEHRLQNELFVLRNKIKMISNEEQTIKLLRKQNAIKHDLDDIKNEIMTISNNNEIKETNPNIILIDQIQKEILKPGDVIVEYLQTETSVGGFHVFIIGKKNVLTSTLNFDAYGMLEKIKNDNDESLQHFLYKTLFQPIENRIMEANSNNEIENLIIVPDSFLHMIPFEKLMQEDNKYLIEKYAISYAPSASILKLMFNNDKQKEYLRDILALAPFSTYNMDINESKENSLISNIVLRSQLSKFLELPYSALEIKSLCQMYPKSICKMDNEATEIFLKNNSVGNRFLHLSTHGFSDTEYPMHSGLLFSENSILQTYEIYNMKIDSEMVVLSACQSGMGELKRSEGIIGLTRAFMYAGASSVVVSLWSVPDKSTSMFMKRFYRNIMNGMTKSKALQMAKIWMIKHAHSVDAHGNQINYNDPFYWAPFILIGIY